MKPAQKLKGARLEAGQTQERDDTSLLAHREESEDAVKSCRAFLRFVLEFCRPRGSKKERCFCCAARCFLQTAFAISTPVSFLYSFSFFHLVA